MEHVLDANVFIHRSGGETFEDPVTVPAVTAELESSGARIRYEIDDVAVREPSDGSIERVEAAADALGEDLSAADVQVVALALDRDAVVVSDDYGVQNVADRLDVRFEPFHQDEIAAGVEWVMVCPNCGREVEGERCRVCGVEPERRSR